ncbi:MAG TPA: sialate O-acetylesterase [Planctomicrobium sp.]|nr:sialate O-acetylesterase [Planctomicrobium sp.]
MRCCLQCCFMWGLALLAGLQWGSAVQAEVRLPKFVGDHMVLQRDLPIPIWGWGKPGEKVTVKLGDDSAQATANENGEWRVELPKRAASADPVTLTVTGENTLTLNDILIGEVWLCSGQSNMEWSVARSTNAEKEIAEANHPLIRQIKIGRNPTPVAQSDATGTWQVCTPQNAPGFTAVGYFMGRELQKELNVPIGLINSSWGGTRIEPWTPPVGFEGVEELKTLSEKVRNQSETAKVTQGDPVALYNGMIHPFVGLPIRGAIWYQGESNVTEGLLYRAKKQALVEGWRKVWGIGDFPFYFVQIAPYQYGQAAPDVLPTFWEAQAAAAATIPNTGMVVINDIATLNDIHPPNKQDVGKRLAGMALKRTYGKADVVDTGATFKSLETNGNQLTVLFENTAGGLKSRDGKPLTGFEIAGKLGEWKAAAAKIDGDRVILTAEGITDPNAVRFAWHKLAEPNLTNGAGWPTGAFRAGEISQPVAK